MILGKEQLPACVRGARILVMPDPPVEDSEIIITPEDQKYLPNKGKIIAAGMQALDEMHDHGDLVGDSVWWGKYAGVMEVWDHIEEETAKGRNNCAHVWVAQAPPKPKSRKWQCAECKSTRLSEHVLVMNVADLLANETLQRRIESGAVAIRLGKLADGRTQHYIDRKDS